MANVFRAKLAIEELFNQYLEQENVEKAISVKMDGKNAYISMQKSADPRSITFSVILDEWIYRFNYVGDPKKRFDMEKLNNMSVMPEQYD